MKKIFKYFAEHLGVVVFSLIVSLVVVGVLYAATTIYNNFSGQVTIYQSESGQAQELGGNVTATGGICDGSEPGTTMCNVDINNLDVTTAFVSDGTLGVTGVSTFTGAIGAGVVVTDTFTQGGGRRATSTVNSAETLKATDFDTENYIDYTSNVQDVTLTLPASSTLSAFIPSTGDARTIFIRNATTTAGIDITIAGGTGTTLKIATTSATTYSPVIRADSDGDNFAIITFLRKASTDIVAFLTLFND